MTNHVEHLHAPEGSQAQHMPTHVDSTSVKDDVKNLQKKDDVKK
jgi:hypothetical protein